MPTAASSTRTPSSHDSSAAIRPTSSRARRRRDPQLGGRVLATAPRRPTRRNSSSERPADRLDRDLEWTLRPVTSATGTVTGGVLCVADVTEATELRAALEERADDRHAHRMSQLGGHHRLSAGCARVGVRRCAGRRTAVHRPQRLQGNQRRSRPCRRGPGARDGSRRSPPRRAPARPASVGSEATSSWSSRPDSPRSRPHARWPRGCRTRSTVSPRSPMLRVDISASIGVGVGGLGRRRRVARRGRPRDVRGEFVVVSLLRRAPQALRVPAVDSPI